jgi:hypothetical protein
VLQLASGRASKYNESLRFAIIIVFWLLQCSCGSAGQDRMNQSTALRLPFNTTAGPGMLQHTVNLLTLQLLECKHR